MHFSCLNIFHCIRACTAILITIIRIASPSRQPETTGKFLTPPPSCWWSLVTVGACTCPHVLPGTSWFTIHSRAVRSANHAPYHQPAVQTRKYVPVDVLHSRDDACLQPHYFLVITRPCWPDSLADLTRLVHLSFCSVCLPGPWISSCSLFVLSAGDRCSRSTYAQSAIVAGRVDQFFISPIFLSIFLSPFLSLLCPSMMFYSLYKLSLTGTITVSSHKPWTISSRDEYYGNM